ncbi:zinc finger protein GLI2 [Lynx canadensis]|uniref:zinc finger protein GLI2 n=1 Tax=Lynx canadensis TaxID=61383 RepID=UPI0011B0AB63|nr:zinc finger protein GLI2 [Lynx canadensis]
METSASVTATEKKDAKSGSLEGVAFPDPGRKASALAVATAAAAAVAAQGVPQHLLPPFHAPLPIDMRHQEGRYHYEPHSVHGVHGPPALSGSPIISDISLIRLSPHPAGPGESPFNAPHPYVSPHMEHYLRAMHSSPTLPTISAARGLSPADVAHEHLKERGLFGLPPPGTNPSDYYHQMTLMAGHPAPYGDLLVQSGGAASAPHLHDYLNPVDVSRFSSPRVTPRLSRKRALSISPLSDASLDLQRMIRTSPNSLVAYINNSRSSSAASGSYGHLSAGTLSPAFTFPHPINPVAYQQILSQQRGLGSAFGHTPPLIQPSPTFLAQQPMALASINATPTQLSGSATCLSDATQNKQNSESAVSSTVNPIVIHKRSKVKTEAEGLRPASPLTLTQEQLADLKEDLDRDDCKQEAEVIIYETNCHWEDCTKEYDTQEQLVHPLPPCADRRGLRLPGHASADGGLARGAYSPRPPSISEHVATEALAVGADSAGPEVGLMLPEDDLVLPDDVVQYIKAHAGGALDDSPSQAYLPESTCFSENPKLPSPGLHGPRRMVAADSNVGPSAPVLGGCQLGYGAPSSLNKNNMPVQWNEVSSGTMDALASQAKPSPFSQGNLAVVQQKPAFGQYPGYSPQGLQLSPGALDSGQGHFQPCGGGPSVPRINYMQQLRQPGTGGQCSNMTTTVSPHTNYGQAHPQLSPSAMGGTLNQYPPSCNNMAAKPVHLGLPQQMEIAPEASMMGSSRRELGITNSALAGMPPLHSTQSYPQQSHHLANPISQESYRQGPNLLPAQQPGFMEPQQGTAGVAGSSFGLVQPRPPAEPSPAGCHRGVRAGVQLAYARATGHAMAAVSAHQEMADAPKGAMGGVVSRPPQPPPQDTGGVPDHSMLYYYGQIHMYEQNGGLENHAGCQVMRPQPPPPQACPDSVQPQPLPSPGVNHVSSTVDSQLLEAPQIDFDAIMDEGDHSSLLSGTLSPSLLHSLSQNSSCLTTPRNSLTLPSIPTGISNMAVGDMSSMLTSLAEESKFLNMMT